MQAVLLPMATLLVRVVLGILFFMQAYDKIFRIGMPAVIDAASTPDMERIIGKNILKAAVRLSSWIELVTGALLIIGFQRKAAMFLLSLEMVGAGIFFSLLKPMWDMQFYFPRLAMLVYLMIIPLGWDVYCLDWMFE